MATWKKELIALYSRMLTVQKWQVLILLYIKTMCRCSTKPMEWQTLNLMLKCRWDASFEIGSVTKQFTGAAICQLAEAGKLNLDDDITGYIKFNTHGKKVTIWNLLTHTSGIKGYTELPVFEKLSMVSYKRDTLLRLLENEPFDFEPGEALIYSNSGFFMLGLIIEKVSGLTYEEYVTKNLFEKAGMKTPIMAAKPG